MKPYLFLLIFTNIFSVICYGQISEHYRYAYKGDSLVNSKKLFEARDAYVKSISYYSNDFEIYQSLAAVYIRLNNPTKADQHLKSAITEGISLPRLKSDTTIKKYFKENIAWPKLYDQLHQQYLAKIPYQEDRTTLLKLLERGQILRELLGKLDYRKVDSIIHEEDLASMKLINNMIKKIGFPDKSKVGNDGAEAIFILLMHTLNSGVDEKENSNIIFPLIEKSIKEGNFHPFHYAILVDRQKGISKEKQVYGTYWENSANNRVITPIENIKSIDKKRQEIGLSTLYYYSKQMNLALPEGYFK